MASAYAGSGRQCKAVPRRSVESVAHRSVASGTRMQRSRSNNAAKPMAVEPQRSVGDMIWRLARGRRPTPRVVAQDRVPEEPSVSELSDPYPPSTLGASVHLGQQFTRSQSADAKKVPSKAQLSHKPGIPCSMNLHDRLLSLPSPSRNRRKTRSVNCHDGESSRPGDCEGVQRLPSPRGMAIHDDDDDDAAPEFGTEGGFTNADAAMDRCLQDGVSGTGSSRVGVAEVLFDGKVREVCLADGHKLAEVAPQQRTSELEVWQISTPTADAHDSSTKDSPTSESVQPCLSFGNLSPDSSFSLQVGAATAGCDVSCGELECGYGLSNFQSTIAAHVKGTLLPDEFRIHGEQLSEKITPKSLLRCHLTEMEVSADSISPEHALAVAMAQTQALVDGLSPDVTAHFGRVKAGTLHVSQQDNNGQSTSLRPGAGESGIIGARLARQPKGVVHIRPDRPTDTGEMEALRATGGDAEIDDSDLSSFDGRTHARQVLARLGVQSARAKQDPAALASAILIGEDACLDKDELDEARAVLAALDDRCAEAWCRIRVAAASPEGDQESEDIQGTGVPLDPQSIVSSNLGAKNLFEALEAAREFDGDELHCASLA